ncbi:MAG: DUF2203 domain-containing protein [Hydrogenothermaceae bacterium]
MFKKYFTLKEANYLLPQIKALVEEIAEKREYMNYYLFRYEELNEKDRDEKDELELMYVKTLISTENQEIKELIEVIEGFGVLVKGLDPVIIDFPAENNGEEIFLCWKEDEESILYWHGKYEGFQGRKPISMLKAGSKKGYFNF